MLAHTDEELQEFFTPSADAPDAPPPISAEVDTRQRKFITWSFVIVIISVVGLIYGSGVLRM